MRAMLIVSMSVLLVTGCASTGGSSHTDKSAETAVRHSKNRTVGSGSPRTSEHDVGVAMVPLEARESADAPTPVQVPAISASFILLGGDEAAIVALANELHLVRDEQVILSPADAEKLRDGARDRQGVTCINTPRIVMRDGQSSRIMVGRESDSATDFGCAGYIADENSARFEFEFMRWVACGSDEWGAGNHWVAKGDVTLETEAVAAQLIWSPQSHLPMILAVRCLKADTTVAAAAP